MRYSGLHRGQPQPPPVFRRRRRHTTDGLHGRDDSGNEADSGNENELSDDEVETTRTVTATPVLQAGQTINPLDLVPPPPPARKTTTSIKTLTAIVPPGHRTTFATETAPVRATAAAALRASETTTTSTTKAEVEAKTTKAASTTTAGESGEVRQGAAATTVDIEDDISKTRYEKGMEETERVVVASPTATIIAGSSMVSSGGMDRGVVIGLASGMAGLGAILVLIVVFFLRWRRKNAKPSSEMSSAKPILSAAAPMASSDVAAAAPPSRPLTTQSQLMNRVMRAVYRVEAGGRLSASTNQTDSMPPIPHAAAGNSYRDEMSERGTMYSDGGSAPRWQDREFALPASAEPSIVSMYARDEDDRRRRQLAHMTASTALSQVSFPSGAGSLSRLQSPTRSERERTYIEPAPELGPQQSRWSESTSTGLDRTISLDFGRESGVPPVPDLPVDEPPRGRKPTREGGGAF